MSSCPETASYLIRQMGWSKGSWDGRSSWWKWKVKVLDNCIWLFRDPMDCSPPGSSVHGILQARILEWVAILFSRGSSQPRNHTWSPALAGRFITTKHPRKPIVGVKNEDFRNKYKMEVYHFSNSESSSSCFLAIIVSGVISPSVLFLLTLPWTDKI